MSEELSEEDVRDLSPKVIGGRGEWRDGKGFSEEELKEANLWKSRKKFPYDPRRKTCHEENIKQLERLGEDSEAKKKELLEDKTVKDLKDMAREKDLSGYSKMKKAELVDMISESYDLDEIRE